jgi:A/G-specific adenine glycosylase
METGNHPFCSKILQWYRQFGRQLPWRESKDPYSIWLSEIILQQTRIEQGTAYYHRFLEEFPSVDLLAQAHEDKILRLWQGLGYYSRARNLHKAAQKVVNEFNGKFPQDYSALLSLNGVGPYTASAIASIAFNLPHAVVDGNVYRVLSRYFGIVTPINSSKGIKEFQELANRLLPSKQAGDYNQGLMDFGATVCKPALPDCANCPLSNDCIALKNGLVSKLPVKEGKIKVRERFLLFVIIQNMEDITIVEKRAENDIWAGLFQFPLIELMSIDELNQFQDAEKFSQIFGNDFFEIRKTSSIIKHILSHQKLQVKFVHVLVEKLPSLNGFQEIASIDLHAIAMPRAITRYLESVYRVS